MPRPRKSHVPLSIEIPKAVAFALDAAKRKRKKSKSAIVTDALLFALADPPGRRRPARV